MGCDVTANPQISVLRATAGKLEGTFADLQPSNRVDLVMSDAFHIKPSGFLY